MRKLTTTPTLAALAAVAVLALPALAGPARAQDRPAVTAGDSRMSKMAGNVMLTMCTSKAGEFQRQCEAFLVGVADTLALTQQLAAKEGNAHMARMVCLPASVDGERMRATFVAWQRAHPGEDGTNAVFNALFAFRGAYPCPAR